MLLTDQIHDFDTTRGVVYVAIKEQRYQRYAARSAQSVKRHLKLPTVLFTNLEIPSENAKHFDKICDYTGHPRKFRSKIYHLSPFEETLHLDADTLVLANLDFGFEMMERFNFVCTISPDSRCRFYGREFPRYAPNVMFFKRCNAVNDLFDRWGKLMDSQRKEVECEDPFLSLACYKNEFNPHVLPLTWNYKPQWQPQLVHGTIRVWNSSEEVPIDINQNTRLRRQYGDGFVPIELIPKFNPKRFDIEMI